MRNRDHLCELLTPVDPTDVQGFLTDDRYIVQVKEDGFRLTVDKVGDRVFGFDRQGAVTAIPHRVAIALDQLGDEFTLDGEIRGLDPDTQYYVVWDLLRVEDTDLRGLSYIERFTQLSAFIDPIGYLPEHACHFGAPVTQGCIRLVRTWGIFDPEVRNDPTVDKHRAVVWCHESGEEGVCFKDKLAIWQPGRAHQHFKLKFWESATCRVDDKAKRKDARWDKRSIALEMCDGAGKWYPMGFCTVAASTPIPPIGAFVEIKYLYAQNDGLYQPSLIGTRNDVSAADCNLDQLKWQKVEAA